METKRIYYYEIDDKEIAEKEGNWGLVIGDEMGKEEKQYVAYYKGADIESIRLATYMDLLDWSSATGDIVEGLLEVKEGLVQFQYRPTLEPISEDVEMYGEYVELYNPDNIVA